MNGGLIVELPWAVDQITVTPTDRGLFLRNQLLGGILMGFGGVLAMGCTIGQGLSGISTLALGSFISVAGIVVGSVAAMKWQER